MAEFGRILVWLGLGLAAAGLLLRLAAPWLPWLGRLPGDIRYEGEHFSFYLPVATCLLLSLLLSLLLFLFRR